MVTRGITHLLKDTLPVLVIKCRYLLPVTTWSVHCECAMKQNKRQIFSFLHFEIRIYILLDEREIQVIDLTKL